MDKKVKEKKKKVENEIIFDPPIKPRYFPGEVPETTIYFDLKAYKRHRYNVINAKPKIDNEAPPIDLSVYYDREKMMKNARQVKVICMTNLDTVKKLNKVYRLQPKVDCWNYPKIKFRTDQTEIILENKLKERVNKNIYEALNTLVESDLSPRKLAKRWKLMKETIELKSRYPWYKSISQYPSITQNATMPAKDQNISRTKCFFDLMQGDSHMEMGRIVFELYEDFVPSICENFKAFCTGYNGLSYKGTPFYRIISGYLCQGGDVTKFSGIGGASIYDNSIPKENYTLQHTCPGVLTATLGENNTIDSNFILTFRPLRTMDGNKVVFGKVIGGMDVLFKIDSFGTKYGEPLKKIVISKCGLLRARRRRSSKQTGTSSKSKKQSTKKQ